MRAVTSSTSSIYSLLGAYYSQRSATETGSDTSEETEESSAVILDEEDVISLTYCLDLSLVNLLGSVSGISFSATSADVSGLYEAISLSQNSDAINDMLISHYSEPDTEDSVEGTSSIGTSA